MSLQNFQTLLIGLYTNEEILKKFLGDRESVLLGYDLDERERGALCALPAERLKLFAASLLSKRHHIAHKLVEKRPYRRVLISSWHHASPALFFIPEGSKKTTSLDITTQQFLLLKKIKTPLTPQVICWRLVETGEAGLRDALGLIRIFYRHHLWGRWIKAF